MVKGHQNHPKRNIENSLGKVNQNFWQTLLQIKGVKKTVDQFWWIKPRQGIQF